LSALIGTAPDAARYSSARFMFGDLQNRGCRPAREAGLSLPQDHGRAGLVSFARRGAHQFPAGDRVRHAEESRHGVMPRGSAHGESPLLPFPGSFGGGGLLSGAI
jgi:hypothetical protein